MIDSYDRRVSYTYMDEYFGDFLFDEFQPFHFYKDDIVDYVIPPEGDRDNYLRFIEELPLVNSPKVFGLHSNAEIGYFTQAVKKMWKHLIELQPQTGASTSLYLSRPTKHCFCNIDRNNLRYKLLYLLLCCPRNLS